MANWLQAMTRYKWLFANWVIPINTLRAMMLASQFTDENSEGFILSRASRSYIKGKFIQKNEYTVLQESPFGEKIAYKRTEYVTTAFYLTDEKHIGLELLNPPRTIRPFVSRLHEMVGLGMIIKDSSIDPLLWAQQIEKKTDSFRISEIQACGIGISNSSVAKVSASSSSDVREDFFEFMNGREHLVQQVKLYFTVDKQQEKSCLLELKSSGIAKFHNSLPTALYSIVRESFSSEIIRKTPNL